MEQDYLPSAALAASSPRIGPVLEFAANIRS